MKDGRGGARVAQNGARRDETAPGFETRATACAGGACGE